MLQTHAEVQIIYALLEFLQTLNYSQSASSYTVSTDHTRSKCPDSDCYKHQYYANNYPVTDLVDNHYNLSIKCANPCGDYYYYG